MRSVGGGVFIDVKQFTRGIGNAREQYFRECEKAAKTVGNMMEKETKIMLSHPGTGRIYKRRGVKHQASAPGEPPAVDMGLLRASVTNEVAGSGTSIEVRVGTNKEYGKELEFGSSKIRPRPWLFRTIKENWAKALTIWSKRLKRK